MAVLGVKCRHGPQAWSADYAFADYPRPSSICRVGSAQDLSPLSSVFSHSRCVVDGHITDVICSAQKLFFRMIRGSSCSNIVSELGEDWFKNVVAFVSTADKWIDRQTHGHGWFKLILYCGQTTRRSSWAFWVLTHKTCRIYNSVHNTVVKFDKTKEVKQQTSVRVGRRLCKVQATATVDETMTVARCRNLKMYFFNEFVISNYQWSAGYCNNLECRFR